MQAAEINYSFTIPNGTSEGAKFVFNYTKDKFNTCTKNEFLKYLRTRFKTWDLAKRSIPAKLFGSANLNEKLFKFCEESYSEAQPFNMVEAMKLEDRSFASNVFGAINVDEVIKSAKVSERIATDGKLVVRKTWDKDGNYLGEVENNNIYEIWKVSGEQFNLDNEFNYALKCWCTTTNKEHWLWIEETFKNEPLKAIADLCKVPKKLIEQDAIEYMMRQGDTFQFIAKPGKEELMHSLTEAEINDVVGLTEEQYFTWIVAES